MVTDSDVAVPGSFPERISHDFGFVNPSINKTEHFADHFRRFNVFGKCDEVLASA